MHFVFYPKHEYGCPHVNHCPHLGSAALSTLVFAADEQTEWTDALHRQIDGLQAESAAKGRKLEEQAARIDDIGLTNRKVVCAVAGLAKFHFAPASFLRFGQEAGRKARPLAQDMAEKTRACEANHADETHYRINGEPAHLYVLAL